MALSAWPTGLPQRFLVDGFHSEAPSNRLRSSVDGAVAKLRRKNSNTKKTFGGFMLMTRSQRDAFWDFYTETLKSGVFTFTFPTPPDDPGTIVVQFREEPTESANYPMWKISLELEELP